MLMQIFVSHIWCKLANADTDMLHWDSGRDESYTEVILSTCNKSLTVIILREHGSILSSASTAGPSTTSTEKAGLTPYGCRYYTFA